MQCHLKEQDIDLRLCLTPNPLILSEDVEVEQSEKVLLEVAVGQPLTIAEARPVVEPATCEAQPVRHMRPPVPAIVGEGAVP